MNRMRTQKGGSGGAALNGFRPKRARVQTAAVDAEGAVAGDAAIPDTRCSGCSDDEADHSDEGEGEEEFEDADEGDDEEEEEEEGEEEEEEEMEDAEDDEEEEDGLPNEEPDHDDLMDMEDDDLRALVHELRREVVSIRQSARAKNRRADHTRARGWIRGEENGVRYYGPQTLEQSRRADLVHEERSAKFFVDELERRKLCRAGIINRALA